MNKRIFAVAFTVCAVTIGAGRANAQLLPAEDHIIELGLMSWTPSPQLTLSTDALAGTNLESVDFVQDFGIEDTPFREFRLTAGRGHKFRLSHVPFKYEAEATLQRDIVFQGQTFTIGAPASTSIKWDLWRFGYEWDFARGERGFFGMLVDVKYNKINASVESPLLTTPGTAETTAPVPTFGVIGRAYPAKMVSITGEFTGLSLNRDSFNAKFYDFDLYGTVSFGRFVGAQAGYRSIVVNYVVDEDSGDSKMKGTYFGGVLKF